MPKMARFPVARNKKPSLTILQKARAKAILKRKAAERATVARLLRAHPRKHHHVVYASQGKKFIPKAVKVVRFAVGTKF